MAATVTITITGDTIGNQVNTWNLDEQTSQILLEYLTDTYGKNEEGEDRTTEEIVETAASGVVNGWTSSAFRWKKNQVSQQAISTVPEPNITKT